MRLPDPGSHDLDKYHVLWYFYFMSNTPIGFNPEMGAHTSISRDTQGDITGLDTYIPEVATGETVDGIDITRFIQKHPELRVSPTSKWKVSGNTIQEDGQLAALKVNMGEVSYGTSIPSVVAKELESITDTEQGISLNLQFGIIHSRATLNAFVIAVGS